MPRPEKLPGAIVLLAGVFLAAGAVAADPEEGEAPAWAKDRLPSRITPFVGRHGLPEPWSKRAKPLGTSVAGIDRWQANHFVVYRPETAEFLDTSYTPLKVNYRPGLLPGYEKVAARYTLPGQSDREKAVALLTRAMPAVFRHPTIPPLGKPVRADRNLADEELLATGCGFCNEQARVYVRLCQVVGIPARMVFLFYADNRTGHVVAEFYADGQWSMADNSWYCVFRAPGGKLLSAAELHRTASSPEIADRVYQARFAEILKLGDADFGSEPANARKLLAQRTSDGLSIFGVLNYPLPH